MQKLMSESPPRERNHGRDRGGLNAGKRRDALEDAVAEHNAVGVRPVLRRRRQDGADEDVRRIEAEIHSLKRRNVRSSKPPPTRSTSATATSATMSARRFTH